MKQFQINKNNFTLYEEERIVFRKVLTREDQKYVKNVGAKYKHGVIEINPRLVDNIEKRGEIVILTM